MKIKKIINLFLVYLIFILILPDIIIFLMEYEREYNALLNKIGGKK